jgi:hypothetical protein
VLGPEEAEEARRPWRRRLMGRDVLVCVSERVEWRERE